MKVYNWILSACGIALTAGLSSCFQTATAESIDVDSALGYCHSKVVRSLDELSRDSIDYRDLSSTVISDS